MSNYLFKERVRKFYSRYNTVLEAFSYSKGDHKVSLNLIEKNIGKYIKHRGQHVHEWAQDHDAYAEFKLIEFVADLQKDFATPQEVSDYYEHTKRRIREHMLCALESMADIFNALNPDPVERLTSISNEFSTLIEYCATPASAPYLGLAP